MASPMAKWVLPVPGGNEVEGAQVIYDLALEWAGVAEVELFQLLRAGNLAARMRPWTPWDSQAATSRFRQATRNSSWSNFRLGRARRAARPPRRLGAFSTWVRKATSVARSRTRGGLGGGHQAAPPSSRACDRSWPGADLHVRFSRSGDHGEPVTAQRLGRSPVSGSVRV